MRRNTSCSRLLHLSSKQPLGTPPWREHSELNTLRKQNKEKKTLWRLGGHMIKNMLATERAQSVDSAHGGRVLQLEPLQHRRRTEKCQSFCSLMEVRSGPVRSGVLQSPVL